MAYTTVNDPQKHFNTTLYTGNNADDRPVIGVGFSPDLTWIKSRGESESHRLFDTTRGATKVIYSNNTNAEATEAATLKSFTSDGFTLGTGDNAVNEMAINFVSWNWLANGGTTSSNTDGTVTSTVQVNSTAGFSIVTWTGNGSTTGTVGHGLGVKPHAIWRRQRGATGNWANAMPHIEGAKLLGFNLDSAFFSASGMSSYNTSTFVDGSGAGAVTSVAYCFAEKQGFSKFNSYTGNGAASGAFIYTGFKPSLVIIKNSGRASTDWIMASGTLDPANPVNDLLEANTSDVVNTAIVDIDFYSNGFKIRGSGHPTNTSGDTYVYMAFAESPFVTSNGSPNNAR